MKTFLITTILAIAVLSLVLQPVVSANAVKDYGSKTTGKMGDKSTPPSHKDGSQTKKEQSKIDKKLSEQLKAIEKLKKLHRYPF